MSDETIAVSLRFGPRLLARVDVCARERGVPRAEFIRVAVDAECTRSEAQAARRERLAKRGGREGQESAWPEKGNVLGMKETEPGSGVFWLGLWRDGKPRGHGVLFNKPPTLGDTADEGIPGVDGKPVDAGTGKDEP